MFPTFIGIGVPKAGTTWLHELLATHPDVYVPSRRKELNYFNNKYDQGPAWYESYFPSEHEEPSYKAVGEISPLYWSREQVPQRVAGLGSIKQLIVMFRDPVDRTYSHYKWARQVGDYRGSFEAFLDRRWGREAGFYCRHLEPYLQFFDRQQILVLIHERIFPDIEPAKQTIAEFLGIDARRFPSDAGKAVVNQGKSIKYRKAYNVVHHLGWSLRKMGLDRLTNSVKRMGIDRLFGSRDAQIEPMHDRTRRQLEQAYAPDVEQLENLLDIDLSCWSCRRTEQGRLASR